MDLKEQLVKRYLHFGEKRMLSEFAESVKSSDLPILISNSSKFINAFEAFK